MEDAAASIYSACRERGARSLDEISSYSSSSRRDVARRCGEIARQLGLKVPLPSPADSVPRMCERLGLGHATAKRAQVVERARELNPVERTETIAATAYLATLLCGEPRAQRTVAEAAGASEVSLRNASRELELRLGLPIFRR